MTRVTQEMLQKHLDYDPATGQLIWRVPLANRTKQGAVAGSLHSRGYVHVGMMGKHYKAHRLIWLLMTGSWPAQDIDHIDGNRANNAWSNLREATRDRNCQNMNAKPNKSCGFKGVTRRGGSFMVRIRTKGQVHYIGSFSSGEEAARAYDTAAIQLHGKFAKTNAALGLL